MDINVARTFLEVVKTGSFVAAAQNLNITQTAVSARIRVLEQQLERPVFIRNKAGARLTPEGERFLRFATTMVQVWARARRAVALPPGRDTVVTVGAELSLWNPCLSEWLMWMRSECPEIAVSAQIDSAERLVAQVQEGAIDLAVLYAAPSRPGVVAELLFEERLVLARATQVKADEAGLDHVYIDWGEDFAASYHAAFPDQPNAVMTTNYGPMARDYLLEVGGTGYFRQSIIRPYIEDGRMELVQGQPEFSYSAYLMYSTRAGVGVMERVRNGFHAVAETLRASGSRAERPDMADGIQAR